MDRLAPPTAAPAAAPSHAAAASAERSAVHRRAGNTTPIDGLAPIERSIVLRPFVAAIPLLLLSIERIHGIAVLSFLVADVVPALARIDLLPAVVALSVDLTVLARKDVVANLGRTA